MNILISTHTYQGYGLGNIYRSLFLYDYLSNLNIGHIYIETNNIATQSIAKQYNINLKKQIKDIDLVVYDSPYNFSYNTPLPTEENERLYRLKNTAKTIIGLDYCRFEENRVDIAINLFNHNKEKIHLFEGTIHSGLKFTILKPEIISAKRSKNQKFLICIGGEDVNNDTLFIIRRFPHILKKSTFIIGLSNRAKAEIKEKIINESRYLENVSNMGEEIINHNLIICNGGTTLLEAIYLKKNIIPIAQNNFEKIFIEHIEYPFNSLIDLKEPLSLINTTKPTIIDSYGKERIKEIILEQLNR